ncbi:DUF3830 family protein [Radiobacillus sp. PE A8.2]|uniref:DUF3830 family protein n=1 Tax=Radiobacillus sp. PE A8.2 TaxID=3380349 RepID=UPI00388F7141
MSHFLIVFPEVNIEVKVKLLFDKAPKTCEGFWDAIKEPIHTSGKHAMYTGREISVQIAPSDKEVSLLHDPAKENLTCFPLPGDILFTFMPEFSFSGLPFPIYDVGLFYGRDARTFFPMGWLPGNLFAQVDGEAELEKLAKMGQDINNNGQQKIIFKRCE